MAETAPLGVSIVSGGAAKQAAPTGSPFLYTNVTGAVARVAVTGGSVSLLEVSIDGGTTYLPTGLLTGTVLLAPNDILRVTYLTAPTINILPI